MVEVRVDIYKAGRILVPILEREENRLKQLATVWNKDAHPIDVWGGFFGITPEQDDYLTTVARFLEDSCYHRRRIPFIWEKVVGMCWPVQDDEGGWNLVVDWDSLDPYADLILDLIGTPSSHMPI